MPAGAIQLAVDQPLLVRTVTLLAAGGLIAPPTGPIGTHFRNATQAKMNGSDCVTVLGARWLSPASDPKILGYTWDTTAAIVSAPADQPLPPSSSFRRTACG
jgi:hypothetical protein